MTINPVGATTYSPKLLQSALVRRQLSQFSAADVGLSLYVPHEVPGQPAQPVDPDEDTLELTLRFLAADQMPGIEDEPDPRGPIMLVAAADEITREEQGTWSYRLDPSRTARQGQMSAEWRYQIDGVQFVQHESLLILEHMPLYQSLSDMERFAVAQVAWMFGDLFDSTEGGPHLTEAFQTHFTSERIAQLMLTAIQKFNFTAQPATNYNLGALGTGMPSHLYGVLVQGTYLETLRHLIRSYTETPDFTGMNVTFTQRRDYADRWRAVLKDEEQDYKDMVTTAKRSLMSLGKGALLVAGGMFGGGGRSLYRPGMQTSLERSWRMYPAAYAVAYPGIG
ncbi:structural protein [Rhodococcus phage E3]|uniref:structural protein n=1 Tax=Rhodococcus phage E3 TaxID=1007869 RepID=UPI0002C6DE80|nr:structural protein [Rhodococcus phage E3]AEQ21021.1 structural protein [Rhodococcus phage E3]